MHLLYSPLNSYLYVHWILDFKSILLLPQKAPYHPWVFPSAPWTRIHIDYIGHVNGHILKSFGATYFYDRMSFLASTTCVGCSIKTVRNLTFDAGIQLIQLHNLCPQLLH